MLVRFSGDAKDFLFTKASRLALGLTYRHVQSLPRAFYPQARTEFKNGWNYYCTTSYAFMERQG